KTNQHQHHADDPETHYNLGFFPATHFKMVVQRRHTQYASALPIAVFCVFEIAHLQHDGQSLCHEHTTHDEQHNFLTHNDSDRAQCATQRQCTNVAHEHLCRICVEPQKGQTSPCNRCAQHHQFARTGDIGKQQVF